VNDEIYKVVAENLMPSHQVIQSEGEIGKGPGNVGLGSIPAVKRSCDVIPVERCHLYVFIENYIVVVIKEPADAKAVAVNCSKYDKEANKGEKIVAGA